MTPDFQDKKVNVFDGYFPSEFVASFKKRVPAKKFGGKRIIASLLEVLVLIGGIASGVVLISSPQLLSQKAQTVGYGPICGSGLACYSGYLVGATECYQTSTTSKSIFCCPQGETNIGMACGLPMPTCAPNVVCPDITLYGTTVCNDMSSGTAVKRRCCPPYNKVVNGMCKPIPTCDPTADCLSITGIFGATECITTQNPPSTLYCCPTGYKRIAGKCTIPPPPLCEDVKLKACAYDNTIIGASACLDYLGSTFPRYCCPIGYKISNKTCIPNNIQLCSPDQSCAPVNYQIAGSAPCYKSTTSTAVSYCCINGYTAQKKNEYSSYECVPPDKIICSSTNPCSMSGYRCNLSTGTCSPVVGVGNCANNYGTCYVKTAIGTSQLTGELCDSGGHWATCAEGYVCSNFNCVRK